MKKLFMIMALVMILTCAVFAFSACDNGDESSAPATSTPAATSTEDSSSTDPVSEEESEEVSTPPAIVYAEQNIDVDRTLTKTLISQGCTYTANENTRGDGFDDDGTKLTDGLLPTLENGFFDGGNIACPWWGLSNSGTTVVIDLGEKVDGLCEFYAYINGGNWGISHPVSVQYFVSDDGENFLPVADPVFTLDLEPVGTVDPWQVYDYALVLEDKGVSGRYVKIEITNSSHLWLMETCVYIYK